MELAADERRLRQSPKAKRPRLRKEDYIIDGGHGNLPPLTVEEILEAQCSERELNLEPFVNRIKGDDVLWKLSQRLPNCVSVSCPNWRNINEGSVRLLALGFGSRLETLDLSSSAISATLFKTLTIRLLQVRNLQLRGCVNLTNQSCRSIAEACSSTITSVDLSDCPQVDHKGVSWFGGTVGSTGLSCKLLQNISVARSLNFKDDGLKSLGTGCKALRFVNLAWCSRVSDSGIIALANGCRNLRVLNIQGCSLVSDIGLTALGNHCKQLRSLCLAGCTLLSDTGLEGLVQYGTSLQSLNMAGCTLVSEHGVFLIVSRNPGMQTLNVSGCEQVTRRSLEEILRGLPYVELADSYLGFKARQGIASLKLKSQVHIVQDAASISISSLIRGAGTRARLRKNTIFKEKTGGANRLQRWWRGQCAREGFRDLVQKRKEWRASIQMERVWRGCAGRRIKQKILVQIEEDKVNGAVVTFIQSNFRGRKIRAKHPEVGQALRAVQYERRLEVRAAMSVRIQAIARSYLGVHYSAAVREDNKQRTKDMQLASNRIQRLVRRLLASLAVGRQIEYNIRRFAKVNTAATNIQKIFRAKIGRRLFKIRLKEMLEHERQLLSASIDIQRVVRGYLERVVIEEARADFARRTRHAIAIQKIFRQRLTVSWRQVKEELLMQRIEEQRQRGIEAAKVSVKQRNARRKAKFQEDSASEEESEDEDDDWQELWDDEENATFFFSPSRGQRAKERPIGRAFEVSLIGRRVRVYWPHDETWYNGQLSKYNKTKNKHRIEYEDEDHEWMDLRVNESRVQIHNDDTGAWLMFRHCRATQDNLRGIIDGTAVANNTEQQWSEQEQQQQQQHGNTYDNQYTTSQVNIAQDAAGAEYNYAHQQQQQHAAEGAAGWGDYNSGEYTEGYYGSADVVAAAAVGVGVVHPWYEYPDESTGMAYYYNSDTGVTTWDRNEAVGQ